MQFDFKHLLIVFVVDENFQHQRNNSTFAQIFAELCTDISVIPTQRKYYIVALVFVASKNAIDT